MRRRSEVFVLTIPHQTQYSLCCRAMESITQNLEFLNYPHKTTRSRYKNNYPYFHTHAHRIVCKIMPTCTNRYPDNRLAITTLRTPDARSAQSNIVIVRFQSYAPTLRCRCVVTTRLQPFGKGNDFFAHPSRSKAA